MSWQDGIIAGTGNSRYLKSVSNFMSLYPTYADFVAALMAGTLPIDLNGINAAGWTQIGTALAKGTLLDDATAAALASAIGMTTPATVNEALAGLAVKPVKVATGYYYGTGTYGSANKNSLTFNFAPKIVMIQEMSSAPSVGGEVSVVINCQSNYAILFYSEAKNTTAVSTISTHKLAVSASANTLSYYSGYTSFWQLNNASTSYSYVAIG